MSKKKETLQEQEKPKTKYDRKMEARRKAAAKERRSNLIFRIVCIVILAALIGTAGYFGISRWIDVHNATTQTYLTVGDHALSQTEYDYYYHSNVSSYINTYYAYLSYIGLDTSKPYDEQQYSEDMTWEDYFQKITIEQIQKEYALRDDAAANGFEYDTTDDWTSFQKDAKTAADEQSLSLSQYYKNTFGDYATVSRIQPYVKNSYLASAYYDKLVKDDTPDDATIQSYYEEHKEDYDKVSFYSFSFDPSNYDDSDEQAAAQADQMVERLKDGDDFETLCLEYAPEDAKSNYESTDSEYSLSKDMVCSNTNAAYSAWLSDESRKDGDITVIQSDDSGVCYVLKFVSRTYDDTCLDTISSTLANNAVSDYLDSVLESGYDVTDVKGEINYLNTESTDTSDTESTDTTEN